MHFWINKGSQGRGINGRYVPPSISAGARRNQLCGEIHPKPMVTPVHRFQSIESVASGAHRHPRAPTYHTRFPVPQSTHHHHNHHHHGEFGPPPQASRQNHTARVRRQSLEFSANGQHVTLTPVASTRHSPIAKLKCGVWAIIGLIPFFVAAAKYYFMGANMGMEVLAVCAILILILLVGGFVSLFEAFGTKGVTAGSTQISSEQNETFEDSSLQVPTNSTPVHVELPPPPYNIAVMLPPTQNERLNNIQDSPPPTYEKAVT